MKIRALLVGLLLVASTTSALAAGPYIGATGGVSIFHDSDLSGLGIEVGTAEYDTGYGFNVNAGYNFDPVRVEFEFGYKEADVDGVSFIDFTSFSPDSNLTTMSYMVNAFYDIKTQSPFTPFIGAGIGAIYGELDNQGDNFDDTVLGYQLIAGVAYNVNKNLAVDLSYRFQHAPSDFEKENVEISYMSSNIMAGIRYNF